jgi:sortase A
MFGRRYPATPLAVGDAIEIDTTYRTSTYRIARTWIVDPDDVSVLDPTPERSITLVTCYPFYFVGSAPQRFIVRAVHVADTPAPCRNVPCLQAGNPLHSSDPRGLRN